MQPGDWATIIGVAVTLLLAIIVSAWVLGNKIGGINSTLESFKPAIADVTRIKVSFGQMNVKVEELWRLKITESKSPSVLNEKGIRILKSSGIEKLTDKYYDQIVSDVAGLNPENSFQVQEYLIQVLNQFANKEECKNDLEVAAFNSGSEVTTILFAAAINIRDKVIAQLGFDREDIDKYDPQKANPSGKA